MQSQSTRKHLLEAAGRVSIDGSIGEGRTQQPENEGMYSTTTLRLLWVGRWQPGTQPGPTAATDDTTDSADSADTADTTSYFGLFY